MNKHTIFKNNNHLFLYFYLVVGSKPSKCQGEGRGAVR